MIDFHIDIVFESICKVNYIFDLIHEANTFFPIWHFWADKEQIMSSYLSGAFNLFTSSLKNCFKIIKLNVDPKMHIVCLIDVNIILLIYLISKELPVHSF